MLPSPPARPAGCGGHVSCTQPPGWLSSGCSRAAGSKGDCAVPWSQPGSRWEQGQQAEPTRSTSPGSLGHLRRRRCWIQVEAEHASQRGAFCSAGLHGGRHAGSRKNGPCELWSLRAGRARQTGWPKARAGPPQILAPGTSQLCSWGPLPPLLFPIPGPPQRVSSALWASWLQMTWGVAAAPPVCLSAIAWANWVSHFWGSRCM